MWTWALELEFAELDKPRRKKALVKGLDLYPLIWADKNMCPHQPDKTRLSPKRHHQWRGWVTHVRIDENPGLRGNTISASTRRAKETASLNALRWYNKNNSSKGLVVV